MAANYWLSMAYDFSGIDSVKGSNTGSAAIIISKSVQLSPFWMKKTMTSKLYTTIAIQNTSCEEHDKEKCPKFHLDAHNYC